MRFTPKTNQTAQVGQVGVPFLVVPLFGWFLHLDGFFDWKPSGTILGPDSLKTRHSAEENCRGKQLCWGISLWGSMLILSTWSLHGAMDPFLNGHVNSQLGSRSH